MTEIQTEIKDLLEAYKTFRRFLNEIGIFDKDSPLDEDDTEYATRFFKAIADFNEGNITRQQLEEAIYP